MEPMELNPQDDQIERSEPKSVRSPKHSRRRFLFKLSSRLNSMVGAVFAVPILGYLLGPVIKKVSGRILGRPGSAE